MYVYCDFHCSTTKKNGSDIPPLCDCGAALQTPEHIVESCPRRFLEGGLPRLVSLDDEVIVWLSGLNVDV